jgi:hypothetical protein
MQFFIGSSFGKSRPAFSCGTLWARLISSHRSEFFFNYKFEKQMKTNRLIFRLLYLSIVSLCLFTQCKKDKNSSDQTEFNFPIIGYVDTQVYSEIKKTCETYWDLSIMTDSTFVIISYIDEYAIHCNGQLDGQVYSFVIRTNLNGKWINDDRTIYNTQGKYFFDLNKIDQLKLESIKNFWDKGFSLDTSYFMDANFEQHPGFLGGQMIFSKNNKSIWISVFKTQFDAIDAMEVRRNNVAGVFVDGTSNVLTGKWWYGESIPNIVVVNQLNTILEIKIYHADFETVEDTLFTTANEVARRIDVLSK